jgi:hypothetical protein
MPRIHTNDNNVTLHFHPRNKLQPKHSLTLTAPLIRTKFQAEVYPVVENEQVAIQPMYAYPLHEMAIALSILQRFHDDIKEQVDMRTNPGSIKIPMQLLPAVNDFSDRQAGELYLAFIDEYDVAPSALSHFTTFVKMKTERIKKEGPTPTEAK